MEKPISSEEIYQDILNRIINLELEPGNKISENRIADEYGVSTLPTFIHINKGQEVGRTAGFKKLSELKDFLKI